MSTLASDKKTSEEVLRPTSRTTDRRVNLTRMWTLAAKKKT